jgi:hypothetical protein
MMNRRDLVKGGLCCLGGAWLCSSVNLASHGTKVKIRINPDLKKKTFPLKLRPFWTSAHEGKLYFLKSMLERLGKETTVEIWKEAFRKPDDGLMEKILAEGWEAYIPEEKPEKTVDDLLEEHFAKPVEGVSKDEARKLVERDYFITLAKKRFPSLEVQKDINTYSSMHLRMDGGARLAEAMIARLGKQGELVAYDIIRAGRAAGAAGRPQTVAEVIKEWAESVDSEERSVFTAGLEEELVKVSDTEVVIHVKACEWARYFTERHPSVGYMVSCSTDDAGLRAINDKLRMQRTSTIMEGGEVCDFRVYAV